VWPVYITVGNIDKDTRQKPSENTVILLGYLPVAKLDKIRPSERSAVQHQLFHNRMKEVLQPLIKAGANGIEILCSDGEVTGGRGGHTWQVHCEFFESF